jgi:hypothetical protein
MGFEPRAAQNRARWGGLGQMRTQLACALADSKPSPWRRLATAHTRGERGTKAAVHQLHDMDGQECRPTAIIGRGAGSTIAAASACCNTASWGAGIHKLHSQRLICAKRLRRATPLRHCWCFRTEGSAGPHFQPCMWFDIKRERLAAAPSRLPCTQRLGAAGAAGPLVCWDPPLPLTS